MGYRVIVATDGLEAVRLFDMHADAISLVLLDFVMPGLKGHDVYERIIRKKPDIRVVFCTGHDPTSTRSRYSACRNVRFLQKPFEASVLLDIVRAALDNSAAATKAGLPPSTITCTPPVPFSETNASSASLGSKSAISLV
jgi:DNA-binding NtrC family response regulator